MAKRAGRLQCKRPKKLDALSKNPRWREMFFWVDDALVPWDFSFYTQGLLPRDERPPLESYILISSNAPEEVPTFIGDDGRGGCLSFLLPPQAGDRGVAPFKDGRKPCWCNGTAGRTMELVLEQPELESTDVLAPTPLRSVPSATVEPPRPDATSVGSSEDADVAEVDSGLKRRRATGDDGVGPSKRVRYPSLGLSTSTEEDTLDASPTLATKEVTETPPPNVEATSDSSAPVTHAAQSPPQTGPKAFEGMPVDQLVEEFDMVTAQQVALMSQLRARFSDERSQSIQKDEEILLLKTQLADAQAEAESSKSYAQNLGRGKNGTACQGSSKSARMLRSTKASCPLAGSIMEVRTILLQVWDEFFARERKGLLEKQEEKLRKLSIEYDEELYPHMLSAIAERSEALARVRRSGEELHEKRLLTVPASQLERDQDYPIDVIMAGLTLARHASEGAEGQPDYFLKPDVAQLQRPTSIGRLAKKKGVKGKAILCSVGAAHIPHSDRVPVSVATVLPKDSELLGKLEEAGDAAYQGFMMPDVDRYANPLTQTVPPFSRFTHPYPHRGLLGLGPPICPGLWRHASVIGCDIDLSVRIDGIPVRPGRDQRCRYHHLWNGHGEVMGVSSCCGWRRIGLCTWQSWHSYHDPRAVGSARWASSTQTSKAQVLLQIEVPSAYCITPAGITRST
ncbi:hypothetical protein Tco_1337954 [Tanacetum coccineum]